MMAVAGAFRKGRAIAGAEQRLATIFNQSQLACDHIDEFVLVRMPVALARPAARWQVHEIDPVIRKPAGVAEPLPHALGTGWVEWRRITRAFAFRHGGDVDLGHVSVFGISIWRQAGVIAVENLQSPSPA